MGFCALDRGREPLAGDEIRACWQSPISAEPTVGLFAMVEAMEATEGGTADPGSGARSTEARASDASSGGAAIAEATRQAARFVRRPVSWFTAEPRGRDPVPPPPPRAADGASGTQPADAQPAGRLMEAPTVAPALRLGSRGDARARRVADESDAVRSAAPVDVVPSGPQGPSANDEGPGLLEGGTVG